MLSNQKNNEGAIRLSVCLSVCISVCHTRNISIILKESNEKLKKKIEEVSVEMDADVFNNNSRSLLLLTELCEPTAD